jgi:pantoate--beta-alanine ligase
VQIINRLSDLRDTLATLRGAGQAVALVPTMGALHEGHMALVDAARRKADIVVTSIFVNPAQFGANEDLDAYPRQLQKDAAMLEAAGVAVLWAPSVDEVYPAGFSTNVSVSGVSEGLCGAARPGHFDGVALVVAKLFNQVRPTHAFFGEKDYQQLAVIRRMARDLDFDLEITGVPTVRDVDGLALSSRNAYLSAEQRAAAVALPDAMQWAAREMAGGAPVGATLALAQQRILAGGFASVDYIELRDADNLALLDRLDGPARLIAAARIGTTRLIDNIAVPLPDQA